RGREAGDAVPREVPQLPQVVLAAPGRTGLALVLDRDAVEADPAEQPLHEAVPLTQLAQRGEGARGQKPEIAGVGRDRSLRQPTDHPVEQVRGAPLDPIRSEESRV